nr:MAG TPA: hypothetical protein [Caudoviricetes sp.]
MCLGLRCNAGIRFAVFRLPCCLALYFMRNMFASISYAIRFSAF